MYFFFNDTATTEIYTLSLHDALPICLLITPATSSLLDTFAFLSMISPVGSSPPGFSTFLSTHSPRRYQSTQADRKSTRLNSSHANISYAVFCLKKKKYYIYSLLSINY